MVMGERTIEAIGNMYIEDLTNNVKAVIVFNTYKKTGFWTKTETGIKHELFGTIYRCQPIDWALSDKNIFSKDQVEVRELDQLKDVEEHIEPISGSWLR